VLDKEHQDLARYRLDSSLDDYNSAKDLLQMSHYRVANNRAYYSIFHAVRAILALEGIDFKKHSAVIAYFRQNYIKTGIFDLSLSDIIGKASFIRNESDYSDFYVATRSEADALINDAGVFIEAVTQYINERLKTD
jgi:uncharacterized protein (UPF0332 family)